MNKHWRASTRAYVKRLSNRVVPELLPRYVLQSVEQQVEVPNQYPKTSFSKFVLFMVGSALWTADKRSTRLLADLSAIKLLQRLSGMEPVSHQTIADRLQTLSISGLQQLITLLSERARHFTASRMKGLELLKLFDCTTIEKSPVLYDWAAPNGDQNAVRIALGVDHQSDMPYCFLDASDTTSDNTIFPELVKQLKIGETGIFDAGCTKIDCFHDINSKGAYWVARMADIYSVQVLNYYNLPSGKGQSYDCWNLFSDSRVRTGTEKYTTPITARRVIWCNRRKKEFLVLWTNRWDWAPKRVLQAYLARWRIEVQIRWLKSAFALDHLPSCDPHGVQAFFLLTLIAWLVLRLFADQQMKHPWFTFSCRSSRTKFLNGLIESIIDQMLADQTVH